MKEVESLRDELEHVKAVNGNLRESLERERKRVEEMQVSVGYQRSSVE